MSRPSDKRCVVLWRFHPWMSNLHWRHHLQAVEGGMLVEPPLGGTGLVGLDRGSRWETSPTKNLRRSGGGEDSLNKK